MTLPCTIEYGNFLDLEGSGRVFYVPKCNMKLIIFMSWPCILRNFPVNNDSNTWCSEHMVLGEYSYDTSMYNNLNFGVIMRNIDRMRSFLGVSSVRKGFLCTKIWHEINHFHVLTMYLEKFYHQSRWQYLFSAHVVLGGYFYDTSMYNNINFVIINIDWMRSIFVHYSVRKGNFGPYFGHEISD